ncbi:ribonuclease H-like domain-containing protein [Methanolobus psychrotolerans]|uniref:ribonuclease H-like domain-containing protein n=1 Tax=Methanolobus psychrotolerans TaxID=1874706 RepID=UPI000B91CE99|nr:ribonuclease H-like domain-containing protein [Methanolobus psychrotolerans]
MLTSTYIHMPRIGENVEKRIWSCGIRTWDDFLDRKDELLIPPAKKGMIVAGIRESVERLESRDFEFFARSLPRAEHWRAFREFSGKVAYVDIETTGLSPGNSSITVVGIYDGKDTRTYVKGIDLDEIVDVFPKYEFLVTFNGARFDLPFIKREFPQIEFNQLHADLMYPLRRISFSGGLKKIECELGISRAEETVGLSGFDAVRLWHQYERGDSEALELLLKYNREDIVNLKTIIDMTLPRFIDNKLSKCI